MYDVNLSELSYLFRYGAYMEAEEIELKPGTYYIKSKALAAEHTHTSSMEPCI